MQLKVSKSAQLVQLKHVIVETGLIATVAFLISGGIIAFGQPIFTRVTLGQVIVELATHHWNVGIASARVLVHEVVKVEPERQSEGGF